ncbi:MAG: cytochrome C assembly protein [Chloroflexi bacterium]|nr:cytochrome C assembly protein [Chloroflexota bacterium]MDP6498046.1 cytochrome c biogenesis protein CcsA [Dehalococcoidia bacterium]MDP7588115.1 cytochrome c biogenesis protein CcsA [Dehalococcoidia bacterium]MQF90255.1 cytochrome C assembly protein [SAR202 cluster bacterium]MQG54837.1 cytochrome C assembly protein [SAR202 cluster bacterium]
MANTQSMERPGSLGEILGLKTVLAVTTGVMMLIDIWLIFMVAPTDSVLGHVQRVFYFHVPIAIMSFLAFFVVFIASLGYLIKRTPKWDAIAHASAEVGVVFVTLALLTGIIWARPIWNTWWTWEPRLTTTMILWLIYVAYLMVRSYAPSQSKGAIYGAVVGILGFVDVPIVYYSVVWWRSVHPSPVVGPFAQADALDSTMAWILLYSFITFVFFFAYMVMERIELRNTEEALGRIRFTLRRRGR